MVQIFVSTPCYGGLCLQGYAESMLQLQRLCAVKGIQMLLDTTENESLITRARNIAIARFLYKTQADYFIFIDADIHFSPDAIIRLIESGHDVAVACYPKKVIMWDQAEAAVKNNDNRDLSRMASSLVMNFKHARSQVVNGFTEVLDGPTGFMCIKRSVIEKMYEHYKDTLTCVNDHQNRDLDEYCAIFDCMIDPVNRRYLSEDYAFCRRWQLMGGQIYADVTTILGHVGNLRFSGSI
jgi:glycosyltransferase involved in cell wall biosynthesis